MKTIIRVFSIFPSIDGEVNNYHQGHTTTFVRFAGCNFYTEPKSKPCAYCDTKYALSLDSGQDMTVEEIMKKVQEIGLNKVTITGGEPLLQFDGFLELTKQLYKGGHKVSVETNGSFPCNGYGVGCWVVDFKLPSSGCMDKMVPVAYKNLADQDFVKFVIMNREDYIEALNAKEWIQDKLMASCQFAFSPAHDKLDPNLLISWLLEDKIDAIVNFQLHKVCKLMEKK